MAAREVSNRLSLEDPCKQKTPRNAGVRGSAEGRTTAVAACRTCGTESLENARFCHGCGSPVDEADTRAEYKQVTVLFADVVHSMDIAAAVGAERLREIMTELVNRASAVVQRYGGMVDKFTGDGIIAVFGAPLALEDHAVRACLAALGVQDEARRLAVDVHNRDGVELRLRVGLNSGQVIVGEIGSGGLSVTPPSVSKSAWLSRWSRLPHPAGWCSAHQQRDWLTALPVSTTPPGSTTAGRWDWPPSCAPVRR
jgi:Adenylate and Guanylate cyclase catalytic domain